MDVGAERTCHSFIRDSLLPQLGQENVKSCNIFSCPSLPPISDDISSKLLKILNSNWDDLSNCSVPVSQDANQNSMETACCDEGKKTKFCFFTLSSLLDDAKGKVLWNKHPRGWHYSLSESDPSSVFLVYINQDEHGMIYIADSKLSASCVLISDSADASGTDFICGMNSRFNSYIVAIKLCYVLFEKFHVDCTVLDAAVTILVPLSSFTVIEKVNTKKMESSVASDPENMTEFINLFEHKLSLTSSLESSNRVYVCQEFQVITKVWSFSKEELVCQSALILLCHKRTVQAQNLKQALSLVQYKQCEDDLVSQLSMMAVGCNEDPTFLQFDTSSISYCEQLLPGHCYSLIYEDIPSVREVAGSRTQWKLPSIKFTKSMSLGHSKKCDFMNELSGKDGFPVTQASSISDIVANRTISSSIVRAILVDKFFSEDKGSSKVKKYTLCLVLKDEVSCDTLRLYIPFYPNNLHGYLPGTLLLLFGCLCICSQKNNLYLKASYGFGMRILNTQASFNRMLHFSSSGVPVLLGAVQLSSRLTCFFARGFLLRILSVKISSICKMCLQEKNICENEIDQMLHIEACFEIDDGSSVSMMHCVGNDVKHLLLLDEKEWHYFVSHVKDTGEPLSFIYNDNPGSYPNHRLKILYWICRAPSLNRLITFHCTPYWVLGERNQLRCQYLCRDISEVRGHSAIHFLPRIIRAEHMSCIC